MTCTQCKDKGTVRKKVGFSYRPKLDYALALKVEYERVLCPACRPKINKP